MENPWIGARWDSLSQFDRLKKAVDARLIDFVEVNYPTSARDRPEELGTRILAHTSFNPLCSAYGMNPRIARQVRDAANRFDSPWIGEHLAMLSYDEAGVLGYVMNPILTADFHEVTLRNIEALRSYYGRPIALELGPLYGTPGEFESEMHFMGSLAQASDCPIILDLAHWTITNRNLRRPRDYGLDAIDPGRVIELHLAGMRKGGKSDFWYDAHSLPIEESLILGLPEMVARFPNLRAVTIEHAPEGEERDLFAALEGVRKVLS